MAHYSIQIPQPCTESWEAMTPSSAGRHCAACQKTVVDFTQQTDAEILASLARVASSTCGRFRAGQVGRPFQPPATTNRWRSWLGALLAVWGLREGTTVETQAQTPVAQIALPDKPFASKLPPPDSVRQEIRGVVLDSAERLPLPGTTVMLKGTNQGVSTDANGRFTLEIPAGQHTLLVSTVGYTTQEIPVVLPQSISTPLEVVLAPNRVVLGETIIIGGYVSRKPWPWHPRALYYWGRYWVTRPFRG